MPRKSSIWQHSGAMEQRHRLTDRTFGEGGVISRVRDSTPVLDSLLYHETDLEITEHYTDTAGFTDHIFALMHLLGFAFAPSIQDLHDKRLFIHGKAELYPGFPSIIFTTSLNLKEIETHWHEVLRLASSIKQGTLTASLMMKKLASHPEQNGLAKALRESGLSKSHCLCWTGSAMNQLDARTLILKNACWFGMTAAGENIALTEFIFFNNPTKLCNMDCYR